MKFLIDAHLPKSLSKLLNEKGFDSVHTLDLPDGNSTTDTKILELSAEENRIIISKDGDFLRSFLLNGKPKKLILVKTGNIKNSELLTLLDLNIQKMSSLLLDAALIEINNADIIVHA